MINKSGFTIIEVIISMAILGFLVSSVSFVYRACVKAFNAGEDRTKIRTELSQVMQLITRDVGAASAITTCASTTLTLTVGGVGVTYLFSNSNLLRNSVVKATNVQAPATSSFSCSAGQVTIDLTSLYNGETVHLRSKVNSSNMPGTNGRGLVGWWKFDEASSGTCSGASIVDSSGSTNIGTCGGSPVWAAGKIGNALNFASTSGYVTFGNPSQLGLSTFTVMCWFNRTGTGTSNTTGTAGINMEPLVAKMAPQADGSNVDGNYLLGLNRASSPPKLAGEFEDSNTGLNHPITGSTATIANATWYHAAYTFDGTTHIQTLYLNGAVDGTPVDAVYGARNDSIQYFGIGSMLKSDGARLGYFNGLIDDVRIYNRALSANEILSVYAAGT